MTALVLAAAVAGIPADEAFRAGLAQRHDAVAARPHFTAAATDYDAEWAAGPQSPQLARNRARAHFLAGDLPRAVLALRDGLALFPWDANLQRDLETCRDAVTYPQPTQPAERVRPDPPADLRNRLSPADQLAASALASALLAVGLAVRITFRPGWAGPVTAAGAIGLGAVAAAAWQIDREERHELPTVVVTAETVLRTGNADLYPARIAAPLPRGAEVGVVGRRGGWVQVQLAGGAVGWLPEGFVVESGNADQRRRLTRPRITWV